MNYFVYVISSGSKSNLVTYVGYTNNLKKRLSLHNKGKGAKFTKGRLWKIIYSENFKTKGEALSREYYIKKNRKFRNLIKKNINAKKNSNTFTT
jgi:putative endonuclease